MGPSDVNQIVNLLCWIQPVFELISLEFECRQVEICPNFKGKEFQFKTFWQISLLHMIFISDGKAFVQ